MMFDRMINERKIEMLEEYIPLLESADGEKPLRHQFVVTEQTNDHAIIELRIFSESGVVLTYTSRVDRLNG